MSKIFALFILVFLSACVPKTSQTTNCSAGQTYSESTRRCIAAVAAVVTASGIPQPPVPVVSSVTYSTTPTEDTAFTATLGYTDANLDPALNCVITTTSAINLTSSCSCTTAGVCKASFLGVANYNGAASFGYYVIDRHGQSTTATVNLVLAASDDTPSITTVNATTNEDVMVNVALPYSDIDGDIASTCTASTIVPYSSEVSFPFGCSCVAGACSAFALPSSNFNGVTYFFYTVTTNGLTSATGVVSTTVTAVNDSPVASTATQGTILEDKAGTVTFTASDIDGSAPYTCTVFNEINMTETTACSCSGTTCTVGVTGNANLNSNSSSFSIDYTVTDTGGATSTVKTKSLTVTAVDDAPISGVSYTSLNPAVPTEDPTSGVAVSLSYSDVDLDLATACTLSNVGNGSAGACTCSGATYPNTCTFTFTPTANINGTNIASFTYTITTGSTTSTTPVAVTFSLSAVNDAPTITTPSNVSYNEATPFNVTGITVDEGGGIDENTQIVSVVASSSNPTLIPNNQISINFNDTGDAGSIPLSLNVVPVSNASGTAVITLTATDNGSPAKSISTYFTVTINNVSYLHNGWKNLKALGVRTNASGTIQENPSVTIEWEAFTPSSAASLAGYKVYRSTTSGGQDFNSPLACNSSVNTCTSSTLLSSQATKFVDSLPSNLSSGTTYYYVIRPVDSNGLVSPSTEVYAEIDVPIPPANMALMHKWIANKEACQKMGATTDPNNNFRCTYSGPGSNGGYYELSAHLFIDRFEAGCNYSRAPKCSSNGCIGISAPTALLASIAAGDIYYNRSTGVCSVYDGSAWQTLSSNLGSWSSGLDREPNVANLPPLVKFTQAQATSYCGQAGRGKRLMTRMEQIAATGWRSDIETNTITNYESGLLLSTNLSCNTMSGTGLTYSNGAVPTTGNEDTLPATLTSTLRTVQTASNSTAGCVSRYGVQDLIGNVREWSSDQFNNCTVGVDTTATTAAVSYNGIDFTATNVGTRGNYLRLIFRPVAAGSEGVFVYEWDPSSPPSIYTDIVVTFVTGVTNANQIANLLEASGDAKKVISWKVTSGATLFSNIADVAVNLSGGTNGAGSLGSAPQIAGTRASGTFSTMAVTSRVYGTHGNNVSIQIVDDTSVGTPLVYVSGWGDIKVTANFTAYNAWNLGGLIAAYYISQHRVANSLVSTNLNDTPYQPATSYAAILFAPIQPVSKTYLTGGGKSFCQGATTNLTSFGGAGYNFDGNLTQGNGPGNKNYTISSWLFNNTDANTFGVNYFHSPVGLPSVNSYDGALLIGGAGMSTAALGNDQIDVNANPHQKLNSTDATVYGTTRGVVTGGGWYGAFDRATGTQGNTGDKAGRYTLDLMPNTLQDNYTGFRCVKTVP